MKKSKKIFGLCAIILALFMLTACGEKRNSVQNKKATSLEVQSQEDLKGAVSELMVAGSEIACGVDPTVYPAADYILNMGAAELLFKVDAQGIIRPSLAKEARK